MSYWKRLRRHPGLIPATWFPLMFLIAGRDSKRGVEAALVLSVIVWTTVLWTARSTTAAQREDGNEFSNQRRYQNEEDRQCD